MFSLGADVSEMYMSICTPGGISPKCPALAEQLPLILSSKQTAKTPAHLGHCSARPGALRRRLESEGFLPCALRVHTHLCICPESEAGRRAQRRRAGSRSRDRPDTLIPPSLIRSGLQFTDLNNHPITIHQSHVY